MAKCAGGFGRSGGFALNGFSGCLLGTRQNSCRVRITHQNFNYLNDLVRSMYPT
nr:hypothetical protein [Alysiella crassa]UOP06064.1 hypothetical protein LVJ80_09445 [Alysiella crassa]